MKIKLGQIVNAVSAMRKLSEQDLSLKKAYEVYKLIKIMNEHLGYFDENREKISQLADNQDKELEDLLSTEIELPDFQKVQINLNEKVSISPLDLMELENFIDFIDE